eukprot:727985-Pelagomonas_calceolata.AAC.2
MRLEVYRPPKRLRIQLGSDHAIQQRTDSDSFCDTLVGWLEWCRMRWTTSVERGNMIRLVMTDDLRSIGTLRSSAS